MKALRPSCLLQALLLAASATAWAHGSIGEAHLSIMGQAPDFALLDQDGDRFALGDLRAKVAVVTFIYTTCTDTCPLLTAKMASLQTPLASDFGPRVRLFRSASTPKSILRPSCGTTRRFTERIWPVGASSPANGMQSESSCGPTVGLRGEPSAAAWIIYS